MLTAEERMELEVLRKHGAGIREWARVTGWSRNTVRPCGSGAQSCAPAAEKLDPFKAYIVDRVKAAAPSAFTSVPAQSSRATTVRLIVEQIQLVAESAVFENGRAFGKCLGHRHFLEEGNRENLEQSVERGLQAETLLDDGNQDVDGNRDPYLCPHRVVRRAVKLLDPKMLLYPFEEQLSGKELARCRTLRLGPFPAPPHQNCS